MRTAPWMAWPLALVPVLASACKPPDPEPPEPRTVRAPSGPASEVAPEPAEPRPPSTIYRSEVQRATGQGPAYLLRQLGPEPYRDMGKFSGWTITRTFPDEPGLCGADCDLRQGDVIRAVNGNRLEKPQELSALLEELPGSSELTVVRVRDGEESSHVYAIAEDR